MFFRPVQQLLVTAIIATLPYIALAVPFEISPPNGTTLPTQLTYGQSATALYTVKNNSSTVRSNNTVRYLPPNVTQVTVNSSYPDLCPASITLQPKNSAGDSCTLQLLITGDVNGTDPNPHNHLFVCFPGEKTCVGSPNVLNVETIPVLPVTTAAGIYFNLTNGYSLYFQTSADNGQTWQSQSVPLINGYQIAFLNAISCSNGACISTGNYEDSGYNTYPSVAVSTDNGNLWSQQILTQPSGYNYGDLSGIYCSGTTCQAVGYYTEISSGYTQPLIASTNNTGAVWTQQILSNPSNYSQGGMNGITCTGSTCIGAGYFVQSNTPNDTIPGIITSTNNSSWSIQTLTVQAASNQGGLLNGVSCTSVACVAVGEYFDSNNHFKTTSYVSTNTGATWTQQSDLTWSQPQSQFNGISCTSDYCVAVGYAVGLSASNDPFYPIIGVSNASGTSWTTHDLSIYPGYSSCELDGVHCTNNTCIAAGYCSSNTAFVPFTAISTDNGATWTEQSPSVSPQYAGAYFSSVG